MEHTGSWWKRNSLKMLLAIPIGTKSLERPMGKWEDNIKKGSQAQGVRSSLNG
jgi:hypothetical protein